MILISIWLKTITEEIQYFWKKIFAHTYNLSGVDYEYFMYIWNTVTSSFIIEMKNWVWAGHCILAHVFLNLLFIYQQFGNSSKLGKVFSHKHCLLRCTFVIYYLGLPYIFRRTVQSPSKKYWPRCIKYFPTHLKNYYIKFSFIFLSI